MPQHHFQAGLSNLVEGFPLLTPGGRARRPHHEYYSELLKYLLQYAQAQQWPDPVPEIDAGKLRQFLTWVGFAAMRRRCYSPGFPSNSPAPEAISTMTTM